MSSKYAVGKLAFGFCDICGQRYPLSQLRPLTIKTKKTNILACPEDWNPDHPQLQLGMYPVQDAWALRNPRPDTSYYTSGINATGSIGEGSRIIQWGWNPVGGSRANDNGLTPNDLIADGQVGEVTVTIS
jgi:hypothetical protein